VTYGLIMMGPTLSPAVELFGGYDANLLESLANTTGPEKRARESFCA
jgi:hypothetical protein